MKLSMTRRVKNLNRDKRVKSEVARQGHAFLWKRIFKFKHVPRGEKCF